MADRDIVTAFSSAAVNKDARDRQHPTARDSHDSFSGD